MTETGTAVEQPKVQHAVAPESKPKESTAGAATSDVDLPASRACRPGPGAAETPLDRGVNLNRRAVLDGQAG